MTKNPNLDRKTIDGFGDESSRFDQSNLSDQERKFIFESYFIIFGSIYYFLIYNKNRSLKNLCSLLLFVAFILFVIQRRTDIVFVSLTFLFYLSIEISSHTDVIYD